MSYTRRGMTYSIVREWNGVNVYDGNGEQVGYSFERFIDAIRFIESI